MQLYSAMPGLHRRTQLYSTIPMFERQSKETAIQRTTRTLELSLSLVHTSGTEMAMADDVIPAKLVHLLALL